MALAKNWSAAAVAIVWKDKRKDKVALIKRRSDFPHHLSSKVRFLLGL